MSTSDYYKNVEPDILKLNNDELNYWLSKFVVERRKKKPHGKVYPPSDIIIMFDSAGRFCR